ncbi:MAG: hypothetical protein U0931_39595 [Vulcanimicrobiota bacterium]
MLTTYLWGAVAAPLALLGPMFLCVREVYAQLGAPGCLHIPLILAAIAWFAAGIWKALDHQKQAW